MTIDPYDPKKMQTVSAQFADAWRDLEAKRRELYRFVLGDVDAIRRELAKQAANPVDAGVARFAADVFELAAGGDAGDDQAWTTATGLPPITSLEHLQIIEAAAVREGFNATVAGLKVIAIRWALRRKAINGRRIFWLCDDCFNQCDPGECPTIGTLGVPQTCPLCGKYTPDARDFTPLFARSIRVPPLPPPTVEVESDAGVIRIVDLKAINRIDLTDQEFAVEEFREYFKTTDPPEIQP